MDNERYERIAKQVNEAIGSDITANRVRLVALHGASEAQESPALRNAAEWLAVHLLNDE